jgi:hypothetical protein
MNKVPVIAKPSTDDNIDTLVKTTILFLNVVFFMVKGENK